MQHMVLHNRPTLSMGTERLACLNSPPLACSWRPSPSTRQVPGSSPGSGGCAAAARAFFLHPPFLPPSGELFSHLPHQPHKPVRVNFRPKFSSQAPKFENFQLTSPQIWKFSVHKPPLFRLRQTSVRKPHTSEIRAAGWKKVERPPPLGCSLDEKSLPPQINNTFEESRGYRT